MKTIIVNLQILYFLQINLIHHLTIGGMCWVSIKNGKCKEVLDHNITQTECCTKYNSNTAWSSTELRDPDLFFRIHLDDGVKCMACKNTCNDFKCGPEQKCVLKDDQPKCICATPCKREDNYLRWYGPVCGSDGRSYKNLCRLRKRACRRPSLFLKVAYKGLCQYTCDTITCLPGKHCLLDRNLIPHCVDCSDTPCFSTSSTKHQICGVDNRTYRSPCHLRRQACRHNKATPIAYRGPCRSNATCDSVLCGKREKCFMDKRLKIPRCVHCKPFCPKSDLRGPVCASNGNTYTTWCKMRKDSCAKGQFIDIIHFGQCVSTTTAANNFSYT